MSTVSVALSPSVMAASSGNRSRLNVVWSLAEMVISSVPTGAPPWLAVIVIVSASSCSVSSSAVMVALPELASAAMLMLAGVIA